MIVLIQLQQDMVIIPALWTSLHICMTNRSVTPDFNNIKCTLLLHCLIPGNMLVLQSYESQCAIPQNSNQLGNTAKQKNANIQLPKKYLSIIVNINPCFIASHVLPNKSHGSLYFSNKQLINAAIKIINPGDTINSNIFCNKLHNLK